MKLFKKLAVLCMALSLCFGVMAACGGNTENSSTNDSSNATSSSSTAEETVTPIPNGFTFKVLKKDGTPATGYQVQICTTDANQTCLAPIAVNDKGYADYPADKTKEYAIHLLDSDYAEVTEFESQGTIPANYNGGVIIITLK